MKFLFEFFIEDNYNYIDEKKHKFPIQVLLDLFEQFEAYYVFEKALEDFFCKGEEGYAYYVYMANQDLINSDNFPPILDNTIDLPDSE